MKKVRIRNPDIRLITIYQSRDLMAAELVKNTLLDHGIECQLNGEHQAGFSGALDIDVMVQESDADRADEIIEIHHPHLVGNDSSSTDDDTE